jgi:hypothetical protein
MFRSRFVIVTVLGILFFGLLVAAYRFGQSHMQERVHSTKAMLAFAHYTTYSIITNYMEKKCYEAALTEAREMRNFQVRLLADNLREAGKDPALLAYIKLRDPQLLTLVLSGQIPEEHSFTMTCLYDKLPDKVGEH